MKVGLVLPGGGARGAYQVGAVSRLATSCFRPELLAGSGIGALNAAVLASGADFAAGANTLRAAWLDLGQRNPLQPTDQAMSAVAEAFATRNPRGLLQLESLFDVSRVEDVLRRHVDPASIRRGMPVWVTVSRAWRHLPKWRGVAGIAAVATTASLSWICLQDVDDDAQLFEYLLASVATPFLFPARSIERDAYTSGALRENVPLRALAENGCTHAVVVHLENGSAWRRAEFPDVHVLEVRPREPIAEWSLPVAGWLRSTLDFRPSRIAELERRGRDDANAILGTAELLLAQGDARRTAREAMIDAVSRVRLPESTSPDDEGGA